MSLCVSLAIRLFSFKIRVFSLLFLVSSFSVIVLFSSVTVSIKLSKIGIFGSSGCTSSSHS